MASNYEEISSDNLLRYGTEISRIGQMLLADRYDDRTHFIFELLQNAEDALGRRIVKNEQRAVTFELTSTHLLLTHFGKPFDEADVHGICGIAESTKDNFSIGRFGIGFKSVYTITDCPEIHSGDEDFSIKDYVQPQRLDRTDRSAEETQIILRFRSQDETTQKEVATAFRKLGPEALLFLRHINEISWKEEGGASGLYLRSVIKEFTENVRIITLIGKEDDKEEVNQNWLIFHRNVYSETQEQVGRVEVAFPLIVDNNIPDRCQVKPVDSSPLVVFFPTVVPTYFGFMVQGPYRTTPSRDNIPRDEPWNQYLVRETSVLLVEAIRWMRDNAMLDISALRCLPLDRTKFPDGGMFSPIFETVRNALLNEPLLPSFDGGFVPGSKAKLARTQELRELINPQQIEALFDFKASAWLSGEITPDRQPEIRTFLMQELNVAEVTPVTLFPKLTKIFLEDQSNNWIRRLYEFLISQEATVRRNLDKVPLIRLNDGTHVVPHENGIAKAFLPGSSRTSFPTIHSEVCSTVEARNFLFSLNITEPDHVDDVILNLLPKYKIASFEIAADEYSAHIEHILKALNTDSNTQREKLLKSLRATPFVMVVDAGNGNSFFAKPGGVYIATERLKQLFMSVPGIHIVDDRYDCLCGEDIRDLLVSCGASRYLSPKLTPANLGHAEKVKIRREAGLERASSQSMPEDYTLRGLDELLEFLPTLNSEEAAARVSILWEALSDLESRNNSAFFGSYKWSYSHETRTARFDANFVRSLNQANWVPNATGELVTPSQVEFHSLDWKPNPFLLSKIIFKPPIINQLAKEAGIDPAILDLLLRNPAIVTELTYRLSVNLAQAPESTTETKQGANESNEHSVYDGAKDLYGDDMPDIPQGTHDPEYCSPTGDPRKNGVGQLGRGSGTSHDGGYGGSSGHGTAGSKVEGQGKRTPGHIGGRPFISYVGTHPNDDNLDPDGLDHAARMKIEANALDLIIRLEPLLNRTPNGNPCFDLFEVDSEGKQKRWVEVKSMTGTLADRPVGLSRTQFDYAREKGDAYWLYIVETATDPVNARVLRIQNPVAHARTFTFDRGWRQIAMDALQNSSDA